MAADNNNREEQDLERYGVWVKAGPEEIREQDNINLELMDIEDSDHDELLITEEEEMLLGELEESSLPDFDDFDDTFDDDLFDNEPGDDVLPDSRNLSIESDGESKVLLHKIEDELNALRNEIRQLKDELTGLRVPSVSGPQEEAGDAGGFFEEEDDETIALTGDELDNILDSADMTEESADDDLVDISDITESGTDSVAESDISFDEEDSIDLSDDFTELSMDDVDDFDIEEITDEPDPALSILGSPDEPESESDPETIEIDIPGMDEIVDLDNMDEDSVVNIDDLEDFEEITDLEDFGLDESESIEIPLVGESPDEMIREPAEENIVSESFDSNVFDEGEEVEIDLNDIGDNTELSDDSEILDVEMEEISLDDFGIEDDEESGQDQSDVLAIDDIEEDIELSDESEDEIEQIEEIDLNNVLADSIEADEETDAIEDIEEIGAFEDIEDLDDIEILDDFENLDDIEVPDVPVGLDEPEEISLEDIEEIELSVDDDAVKIDSIEDADGVEDIEIEEIDLSSPSDSADEAELEEIDLLEEIDEFEELPELSLDEAIDEMDSASEFSIDDSDGDMEIIEDLEIGIEDESDQIQVTLPDDDFNELPGTEEVDLESLEALAAAPDLTEEAAEDFIELPELDEEEPPNPDVEELREQTKAALEISSLPGDLKEEIKDVLKYMDQLLESLPDDKIQEFARSEHFEVYKKIFEELGISD